MRRFPIIGLAGGIGAGKSRVAREFERLGCLVIDSDELSRQVVQRPDVKKTLQSWWGQELVKPDRGPDARRIADIIFADPQQRRRFESLVHPLIARLRGAMIKDAETDPTARAVILDSPLLFESNLDRLCDSIVFVDADLDRRLQRLKRQRGWNREELCRREKTQIPLVDKRAKSGFVVNNQGPARNLRPQVAEILEKTIAERTPKH